MSMNINTVRPSVIPGRRPGDFVATQARQGGTLAAAAAVGRARPGEWVFVENTVNDRSRFEWVNYVRNGRKVSLGGGNEQWDAEVIEGVIRDGVFVPMDQARPLQPGEGVVFAKYITFLGPRDSSWPDAEVPS